MNNAISQTALSSTNVLSPVLSTTTSYQTSIVTFSTGPTVSTITTTKTIGNHTHTHTHTHMCTYTLIYIHIYMIYTLLYE